MSHLLSLRPIKAFLLFIMDKRKAFALDDECPSLGDCTNIDENGTRKGIHEVCVASSGKSAKKPCVRRPLADCTNVLSNAEALRDTMTNPTLGLGSTMYTPVVDADDDSWLQRNDDWCPAPRCGTQQVAAEELGEKHKLVAEKNSLPTPLHESPLTNVPDAIGVVVYISDVHDTKRTWRRPSRHVAIMNMCTIIFKPDMPEAEAIQATTTASVLPAGRRRPAAPLVPNHVLLRTQQAGALTLATRA
ncbi:hypothetical protein EJB05_31358, partial [Eragrostis curvula]